MFPLTQALKILGICISFAILPNPTLLGSAFNLAQVPRGKSITLGRPATTKVPLSSQAKFAATDLPQTLKIKIEGPKWAGEVKLAIFDKNSEKVRYINLQKGVPFLYPFKDFRPIMVTPDLTRPSKAKFLKMIVESDKPLEVGR